MTINFPHNAVELFGGRPVDMLFYEPDPVTFHGHYYYNTTTNRLYRKILTVRDYRHGRVRAKWVAISQ